jgi:hypothetical protein
MVPKSYWRFSNFLLVIVTSSVFFFSYFFNTLNFVSDSFNLFISSFFFSHSCKSSWYICFICYSRFFIYASIGYFSSFNDLILWSNTNLKFSKWVFIFLKSFIFFSLDLITSSLSPNYSYILTNLVLESNIFLWNYSYSYPNLN